MGQEIEHKYLVRDTSYRNAAESVMSIRQGYLSRDPERVVRLRIINTDAYITVKGKNNGAARMEFEYPIPIKDAEEMLAICEPPVIEKTRFIVNFSGFRWEIDEIKSPCKMTVAEIEIPATDMSYPIPPFIGENITGNEKYYNSNLK